MPVFALFCSFLFHIFNPSQARGAPGIAFFPGWRKLLTVALHSLVLLAMLEGGAQEYPVAYHKQEEWLSCFCCSPSCLWESLSSEESCRELGSFPAWILPPQPLIRSPVCSKASASAIWKRNSTCCAIAGFSYRQATVTHKQLQDLAAWAALFWKQKWSHGASDMYQAVAKRTGLSNRPGQINSVGSCRMHWAAEKYDRICS